MFPCNYTLHGQQPAIIVYMAYMRTYVRTNNRLTKQTKVNTYMRRVCMTVLICIHVPMCIECRFKLRYLSLVHAHSFSTRIVSRDSWKSPHKMIETVARFTSINLRRDPIIWWFMVVV